jgi:hypothetical protein
MLISIDKVKQSEENPRTINVGKLNELKKSITNFPEMMNIRPIVVDKNFNIVGGNMRYLALKELGYEEIEVEVLKDDERAYEFMIKDNLSYGDWDWTVLSQDFKSGNLSDFGLDVPLWFRDLEKSVEKSDKEKEEDKEKEKEKKEKPTSTKKAFYLFFSLKEKEEVVELLKKRKNGSEISNEIILVEIIKKYIKENEGVEC